MEDVPRATSARQCFRDCAHLQHQAPGDRRLLKSKVPVEGGGRLVEGINYNQPRGDLVSGSESPAKSVSEERSTQT